MKNFRQKPPDALSDSNDVQEFMRFMEQAFSRHPLWSGCSQEDIAAAVEVRVHGKMVGSGHSVQIPTPLFSSITCTGSGEVSAD